MIEHHDPPEDPERWLQAPAAIRIPAGFEHSADVGDAGVECVEGFERG